EIANERYEHEYEMIFRFRGSAVLTGGTGCLLFYGTLPTAHGPLPGLLFSIHHLLSTRRAPIAQLDRASDFESEGRRFESCWVHQFYQLFRLIIVILLGDRGLHGILFRLMLFDCIEHIAPVAEL